MAEPKGLRHVSEPKVQPHTSYCNQKHKMNPKGKIHPITLALITLVAVGFIILVTASLNTQIPDQILPVNSSSELNLSTYFPEFQENVWFSVSGTGNVSVVFGKSLAEPYQFYRNPSVTIVPFKNWAGEEVIEFKATNGTEVIKKSVIVKVV